MPPAASGDDGNSGMRGITGTRGAIIAPDRAAWPIPRLKVDDDRGVRTNGQSARRLRSSRAFTVLEMMIVILIVAIVAAMATARLGDTSITRLRAAAQLLAADLGYAQVESIAHGDDLRIVVFDLVNHRYHVAAASDIATPINNPVTKSPYRVVFGQGTAHALTGVTIAAVSLDGDSQLQFGAYGQLDQVAAATITLSADGHTVTVTVDPVTGEASIGDIQ